MGTGLLKAIIKNTPPIIMTSKKDAHILIVSDFLQ
ncbi:thiamine thiazole synthase [Komagataella phaffii]